MAKTVNQSSFLSKNNMTSLAPKVLFLILPLAVSLALLSIGFSGMVPARIQAYFAQHEANEQKTVANATSLETLMENCYTHEYTTEIISLDPLVIYINNFTSAEEAEELIKLGTPHLTDSLISRGHHTGTTKLPGRTSQSAPIPLSHPLTTCILHRARAFMGGTLQPYEPFSPPQMVRYEPGQKYDLHTDFWPERQVLKDGTRFNRLASFFVFLRDECEGGETNFPLVEAEAVRGVKKEDEVDEKLEKWFKGKVARGEVDGVRQGVKFKPIQGNGIFWVNLNGEGREDWRVVHGGLPVVEGEKIGMNLWPRKFFGKVDG